MKTYIFTILLLLWSVSARAEKGGGSVEDNKEDVSVHELLRYTVQTDVEEFLAIQYAAVDHYMREASFKEINDSSSIDLQHRFFQHGPPFCLQRRNHEIYYDDKNCLYLNIWRRRNSGNKVYPVVVWLVGGLFKEGGAGINKYKVHSLVSKLNVVLVVVQYRIGAGGFFFLNNEYAAGNNGLKDQVLALEWVKRYIQHFKGDKNNIVLVGDEAGAASVGYHLLSSKTSNLFNSAVMINGAPFSEWAFLERGEAYEKSMNMKKLLNCHIDLTCMETRLPEEVFEHEHNMIPKGAAIKVAFAPTQENKIVPEHPLQMLHQATHLNGKKIIIGNSKDAGRDFVNASITYHDHFKKALLPTLDNNVTIFTQFNAFYKNITTVKYYSKILADIFTDRYFRCPADEFVKVARKQGAVVYQFELDNPNKKSDITDALKYFMFNTENFKTHDWVTLQKSGYQFAGFVENGDPSAKVNMNWGEEVFYMGGSKKGEASDRTQQCKFLKETLTDYLPDLKNSQMPLKMSMLTVLVSAFVMLRVML